MSSNRAQLMFLADLEQMPHEIDGVPIVHMPPRTIVSMMRLVAVGTQSPLFVLISAENAGVLMYQETVRYPSDNKLLWSRRYERFFDSVVNHIVEASQTVPRWSTMYFSS